MSRVQGVHHRRCDPARLIANAQAMGGRDALPPKGPDFKRKSNDAGGIENIKVLRDLFHARGWTAFYRRWRFAGFGRAGSRFRSWRSWCRRGTR